MARGLLPRPVCLGALKPCLVAPSPDALSAVTRPNLAPGSFTGQDAVYFEFFKAPARPQAIGALSEALHLQIRHPGKSPRRPSVSPPLDGQQYHEDTLAHHFEVVSMIGKFFTAEQLLARPSTVLIVTLLFIAFEFLQGNVGLGMAEIARNCTQTRTKMQHLIEACKDKA